MTSEGGGPRGGQALLAALALSVLLSVLDYVTGFEIDFAPFYLLPVFLVAWNGQARVVWTLAILDSSLWQIVNLVAGELHSQVWIYVWNAFSRFVLFLIPGLLVVEMRSRHHRDRIVARLDPLTGLLNRRAFLEEVAQSVPPTADPPRTWLLAILDINHLSWLVSQKGRFAADHLLIKLGKILIHTSRPGDLVGRLEGNQLVLFLFPLGQGSGEKTLERIEGAVTPLLEETGGPLRLRWGAVSGSGPTNWPLRLLEADGQLNDKHRKHRQK